MVEREREWQQSTSLGTKIMNIIYCLNESAGKLNKLLIKQLKYAQKENTFRPVVAAIDAVPSSNLSSLIAPQSMHICPNNSRARRGGWAA